jgi:hypothetical protein
MEEYISADPCKFDHHNLFKSLQTLTLDFRLSDPYCSLVRWNILLRLWDCEREVASQVLRIAFADVLMSLLAVIDCAGLVQSRATVRVGRVLRPVRRSRLLPPLSVPL